MTGSGPRLALVGAEVLAVPKSATEPSEDAAALDPARGLIAVSDGATRALASGPWARCLVRRFVARPPEGFDAPALRGWVRAAAEEWSQCVRLSPQAPPYLWDAVERGSYATLLGLVAEPAPPGADTLRWKAVAVGDTCLVALRADAPTLSFPLHRPEQFTSAPALLPTSATALPDAVTAARVTTGAGAAGDDLLVMTDALARWALTETAHGPHVWRFLRRCDAADLTAKVRALWRRGELEEDDITLARCRVARV
ncbi:protein phosphatase 2C domain-containing protein [Streptomyces sp. AN091965]|uniref:protein phosphatase 2C domain-containing protein n=1 Tax=Streptomyces sp. AN091965 TaxID=2927803 RepID=UPI001F6203A1|nr:protein phosphatase 2C domain-containing protein [Streptomyces sp. AN091965]MCI3935225.1 protein phosphatase 2C domain-containing protein [Streptomyces sp. AN091965]